MDFNRLMGSSSGPQTRSSSAQRRCANQYQPPLAVPELVESTMECTDPIADSWCQTKLNIGRCSYTWTVSNFSYIEELPDGSLFSAPFSSGCGPDDNLQWCLCIVPRGPDDDSKNFISLYLLLRTCVERDVLTKFRFSIINATHRQTHATESHRPYAFQRETDWGFKKFVRRDLAFKALVDDTLTVCVELLIVLGKTQMSGSRHMASDGKFAIPEARLDDHMGDALKCTKYSDVIMCVGDKEFPAHRAILAARSSVFAAMLEHDSHRVHIEDMSATVFGELLQFVYTGSASVEDDAEELLAAANKYDLPRLKAMCEAYVVKQITTPQVARVLQLADLHNADGLKAGAIKYITTHANDVIDTPGWNAMIETHPHLINDAYRAMATCQIASKVALRSKDKEEEGSK